MDFLHYLANLFTGNTSGNGTGAETAGVHIPTVSQSSNVTSPVQVSGSIGNPSTGTPASFSTTPNTPPSVTLASGNASGDFNLNVPGLPNLNLGSGLQNELPHLRLLKPEYRVRLIFL